MVCIDSCMPRSRRRFWRRLCWASGYCAARALHFDGFVDAVDGLLGGRTPEDRLRIQRDESVGAFAVAGAATLLLLKFAALGAVWAPPAAYILAPLMGRWVMSVSVALFPYARAEGLGRAMKDSAGWPQAVVASAISVVALAALAPSAGMAATAARRCCGRSQLVAADPLHAGPHPRADRRHLRRSV